MYFKSSILTPGARYPILIVQWRSGSLNFARDVDQYLNEAEYTASRLNT